MIRFYFSNVLISLCAYIIEDWLFHYIAASLFLLYFNSLTNSTAGFYVSFQVLGFFLNPLYCSVLFCFRIIVSTSQGNVFIYLQCLSLTTIVQCTEVRFVSFLSCGFITAIVVNPSERKLAKRTSVQCTKMQVRNSVFFSHFQMVKMHYFYAL